jgi:hypothetical protein
MDQAALDMISPAQTALFIPNNLKKFKLKLFERIGAHIASKGGRVIYHDPALMDALPNDVIPIIGCHPELRSRIDAWTASGREFVYWDRGYAKRIFATWLPRPKVGSGYYRWTRNAFQMREIRDVPKDRWMQLDIPTDPWKEKGKHIVIAKPSATYDAFHRTHDWLENTIAELKRHTDRKLVIREKLSETPLRQELVGAHALVTHQSNAAVEAVIMGCPVFVDPGNAAALVGQTDLSKIETPVYPDRKPWLWSLAYSQFSEDELVNGVLWEHLA